MTEMDTKERLVRCALRLSCLCHTAGLDPEEAVGRALEILGAEDDPTDYPAQQDLVGRIIFDLADADRLAVERIQTAVQNHAGLRRTVAAYRANAGVLPWAEVERLAAG
jgi:hypothetical protein